MKYKTPKYLWILPEDCDEVYVERFKLNLEKEAWKGNRLDIVSTHNITYFEFKKGEWMEIVQMEKQITDSKIKNFINKLGFGKSKKGKASSK